MKFTKDAGLCALCHKRPAKFKRKGKVKHDKDHDLCQQCFRSVADANWAARKKEIDAQQYAYKVQTRPENSLFCAFAQIVDKTGFSQTTISSEARII